MITSLRRQLGAWASLAAVALAATVAWRVEVESGDEAGRWWVTYTHWAMPTGCLLFVGWAAVVSASLARVSRVTLGLTLLAVMFVGLGVAEWGIRALYAPFLTGQSAAGWALVECIAAAGFLATVPLLVAIVARLARLPITWGRVALSEVLWLASPLLAVAAVSILYVPDPVGQPFGLDFAHAIKTGFIVPPLVVSLGILFIFR
jgi:hypothetical protein